MSIEIRKLSIAELRDQLKNKIVSVREVLEAYHIDKSRYDFLHCFQEEVDFSEKNTELWQQVQLAQQRIDQNTARALEGIPLVFKDNYCIKNKTTTAGSTMLQHFIAPYTATVAQNLFDQGVLYFGKANMDPFSMGSGGGSNPLVLSPWSYFPQDKRGNQETDASLDGNQVSSDREKIRLRDASDEVLSNVCSLDKDAANACSLDKNAPNECFSNAYSYLAGGSSSGSASIVAAGLAPAAMGSDTGGSIRQPAAWCGLVGYRPTYGLASRYGIISFASSLDQACVVTKTVRDNALIMKHVIGFDEKDSRSSPLVVDDLELSCEKGLKKGLRGLRIGLLDSFEKIPLEYSVSKKYDQVKKICQDQGASLVDLSSELSPYSVQAYYIISSVEASSNMARYNGIHNGKRFQKKDLRANEISAQSRGLYFSSEVLRRILIGTHFLGLELSQGYYSLAKKFQAALKIHVKELFQKVDVILMPTVTETAWTTTQSTNKSVAETWDSDIFTVWSAVCGVPSITIPCGLTESGFTSSGIIKEKKPIGFQLAAPHFQDGKLFEIASALESFLEPMDLPFV